MLKTMRKNVKALKPVLWIIVATFLISIWAIWGGAGRLGEATGANTLATVGGEKISGEDYSQALRQRIESVKKQFSGLTTSLIQQLNIPQQTMEQIIQQRLLVQTASRMGLRATDQEVRDRIVSYPVFQRDGQFVGFDVYKRILDLNHIPLKDFEEGLKQDVVVNKVVGIITTGITVTDDEAWANYKKQNETAKVEYLVAGTSKMEIKDKPSEAAIEAEFAKNGSAYRIPAKRTGEYVFLRTDDAKKNVKVEPAEIEKYFKDNQAQFMEPEKIKVSRIWLPYTDKDKAAVEAQAKAVLEKARGGADFAQLAKTSSKDDKAKTGGDWGLFDWKSLAAKETEAVGKLNQGQISDLIEPDGGVAILKVTEKSPAVTKTLAEVSVTIKGILEDQKARTIVADRIQRIEKQARKDKSLDLAAQKEGLKVASTGPLKKGDPLGSIDSSGSMSESLFALKDGEISPSTFNYAGVGLVQLEKIEPERPAKLDEVRSQVEGELLNKMKKDKALLTLKDDLSKLKDDWNAEASKFKLEYKTVDAHKREQYLGLIGENPEIDSLIFSLPLKQVSAPAAVDEGYAVFRVLSRKEVGRADFDKTKDAERQTLLEQKKNEFLQSYLAGVRDERKVRINYDLFQRMTNEVLARYGGGEQ